MVCFHNIREADELDRANWFAIAAPYLKLPLNHEAVNSVTRGLVGDTAFAVLPDITPRMTFVLTLAAQIVSPFSRSKQSFTYID